MYTDWQLDQIRRGLGRYRSEAGRNGRPLSWGLAALRIERAANEIRGKAIFYSGRAEPRDERDYITLTAEALRRFARGETVSLKAVNLAALVAHLVRLSHLSTSDLAPDIVNSHQVSAVLDCLANLGCGATEVLERLPRSLIASRVRGDRIHRINLELAVDKSKSFVRVRERFESLADRAHVLFEDDRLEASTIHSTERTGFGFLSTRLNLLQIFVKGKEPDDHVTYVQATDQYAFGELHLIRNGQAELFKREIGGPDGDPYRQATSIDDRVYCFAPE